MQKTSNSLLFWIDINISSLFLHLKGAAAIYVTHDLAVVAQIADRIVVLYNGDIQEKGTANDVISKPRHPYTKRLMKAVRPLPAAGKKTQANKTDKALKRLKELADRKIEVNSSMYVQIHFELGTLYHVQNKKISRDILEYFPYIGNVSLFRNCYKFL